MEGLPIQQFVVRNPQARGDLRALTRAAGRGATSDLAQGGRWQMREGAPEVNAEVGGSGSASGIFRRAVIFGGDPVLLEVRVERAEADAELLGGLTPVALAGGQGGQDRFALDILQ